VLESCTVSFNGRDRPTDQRLVYGKSRPTRMLGHSLKSGKNNFSLYTICVEFPFFTPCWVEHFVLNFSFYTPCRVAYWTDCVQFNFTKNFFHFHLYTLYWILLKTLAECPLHTVGIIQSFYLLSHLSCSVIMEDSADIELYEELVSNPAYSSYSDTSESDPVSFQFKEPMQTKWM